MKMTRKEINNSTLWSKLQVKRIKGREYFVESIVYVNYWTFYYIALVFYKRTKRKAVRITYDVKP